MIARIAVGLGGPSGPVVLLCEGPLAKLREELVEAIERNRLRRVVISTPNGRPDGP